MAQQVKNLNNTHEDAGLIPGLTQRVKVPTPLQHSSLMRLRSGGVVAVV